MCGGGGGGDGGRVQATFNMMQDLSFRENRLQII